MSDHPEVPDLAADIVPGQSAAGVSIGMPIEDFLRAIGGDDQVAEGMFRAGQWTKKRIDSMPPDASTCIYYTWDDYISVAFYRGRSYLITCGEKYCGRAFGAIRIGDDLSKALDRIRLTVPSAHFEWDSGEDQVIPVLEGASLGIGFIPSDFVSYDQDPKQTIVAISVQNWSYEPQLTEGI